MSTLDLLKDAPANYYKAIVDTRDPTELHVSDLVACTHAVWRRRNGMLEPPVDADVQTIWARGRHMEAERVKAYVATFEPLGYECFHGDNRLYVGYSIAQESFSMLSRDRAELRARGFDDMTGEIDFAAINGDTHHAVVTEIKSVAYLEEFARFAHVLQLAAYALPMTVHLDDMDVETFLTVVSVVDGKEHVYPVDPLAHGPVILERARALYYLTGPGSFPPPDQIPPEEAWQLRGRGKARKEVNTFCEGYCRHIACDAHIVARTAALNAQAEANPNPERSDPPDEVGLE